MPLRLWRLTPQLVTQPYYEVMAWPNTFPVVTATAGQQVGGISVTFVLEFLRVSVAVPDQLVQQARVVVGQRVPANAVVPPPAERLGVIDIPETPAGVIFGPPCGDLEPLADGRPRLCGRWWWWRRTVTPLRDFLGVVQEAGAGQCPVGRRATLPTSPKPRRACTSR